MDPKDPSIEYKWFDVGVLDYDPESKLYFVQKVNAEKRVVDDKGKPVVNGGIKADGQYRKDNWPTWIQVLLIKCFPWAGKRLSLPTQYWVPRIRLMYAAEDPDVFAQRVSKAFFFRRSTEGLLRYNLYIDCMPMEGVGELDQASLKRMTEWAKGAPSLAKDKGYRLQWFCTQLNCGFCG